MNSDGQRIERVWKPLKPRRASPVRRRTRLAVGVLAAAALAGSVAALGRLLAVARDERAARRAVAAGRFAEAEVPLGRWLRARPGSAEAQFLRARVALARDRQAEALDSLATARSRGYPEPEIARLMAILLARTGQVDSAEPLLRRILRGSSRPEPEVARELARIDLEAFRLDSAAVVLERWKRDAPRDATPYLWQIEIDRRKGTEPHVTVARYREALKRAPDRDDVRLGLAEALRAAHRPAEAAREYSAFLARHPVAAAAYLGLGRTEADQGKDDAAIRALDRALALAPDDPQALGERAALALRCGDLDGALARLDRAIARAPRDAELRYRRTLVLARLGLPDQARRDQAEVDRLRRDQAEVNALHDRLIRAPANPHAQLDVARWMLAHDHADEGLRWTRQILHDHPGHAPTHRLLADYYARLGNSGLANYHRLQARAGE
jgi:tetratricopeptide (TPR) repeat protein